MEYKLNKVDTDLRQKINDATKEGKVHSAKNIAISKDKPNEQNERKNYKVQEYNRNNKIVVEANKVETIEIVAYKDKEDIKKNEKGTFFDIKT